MSTGISRVLAGVASLLVGATASAAGASQTVAIDTEQKAVAAFITASATAAGSQQHHRVVMPGIINLGLRALQTAASVTTPAALSTLPSGIEIPCQTSGSMVARMAPRLPRVFRFEWKDCRFQADGQDQTLNGPGEIILLSDSFTAARAASIRFGSLSTNLVHTFGYSFPTFSSRNVHIRNVLVVGSIPLENYQYQVVGRFTPFTYLVTGFFELSQTNQFGTDPEYTISDRYDFDAVAWTGSHGYSDDGMQFDEDLKGLFGKLTFTRREPPPYGTHSETYSYAGFHVHDFTDYAASERTQTIDGRLNYVWNPNFGAGCVSGSYDFKTIVPIRRLQTSWYQPYDSGELVINGTERVSFYSAATVPPTLPAPANLTLMHVEAAGVGTFNYDINDLLNDLRPISRCM